MFTLAHLSDPHVPSPLRVGVSALATKRALGYWSWRRRRVYIHSIEVLEALTRDLAETVPDHVAVTGDLVNISLPSEFAAAARWLETLGGGERVSIVPGNHDAYVAVPLEQSWDLWRAYMASDGPGDPATAPAASGPIPFPYVRRRGRIAIVGLCTAVPTPPGWASGRLGRDQLERLGGVLAAFGDAGMFRVVLLHHPPIEGDNPLRKRLTDAADLQRVIARHGAELLLHGHDHRCSIRAMAGPAGGVPAVGVPSASASVAKTKPIGQYNLYDISPSPRGWSIDLRVRRYDATLGRFQEAGGQRVAPQPADGATMDARVTADA